MQFWSNGRQALRRGGRLPWLWPCRRPMRQASTAARRERRMKRRSAATRTLSELDVAMATLYGVRMQIPMLMGARGAAQDEQRAWLAERHACGGDLTCLTASYHRRIVELDGTITEAMHDYCTRLGICGNSGPDPTGAN